MFNSSIKNLNSLVRKISFKKYKQVLYVIILIILIICIWKGYKWYTDSSKLAVLEGFTNSSNHQLDQISDNNSILNFNFSGGNDLSFYSTSSADPSLNGHNTIISKTNPGSSGYVLEQTAIKPGVSYTDTHYKLQITDITPGKHYVISAWEAVTNDWNGRDKLFTIITTNATDNTTTTELENNGEIINTISNTSADITWNHKLFRFNVPLDESTTIDIKLGNKPNNTSGKRYLTEVKFGEYLPNDKFFSLIDGLTTYLNTLNNNSLDVSASEGTSTIFDLSNFIKSDGTAIAYDYTLPSSVTTSPLNIKDMTIIGPHSNTIDDDSFSICLQFKIKVHPSTDTTSGMQSSTYYDLIHLPGGFTLAFDNTGKIRITDTTEPAVVSTSSNTFAHNASFTTICITYNSSGTTIYANTGADDPTLAPITFDNNLPSLISFETNPITINPSTAAIVATTTIPAVAAIDPTINMDMDLLGLYIYDVALPVTKLNKLHSYMTMIKRDPVKYNNSLNSDMLEDVESAPEAIDGVSMFFDTVTLEYIIKIERNSLYAESLGFYGEQSYGVNKSQAKKLFIKNFPDLELPELFQSDSSLSGCPYVVNADNPCYKTDCEGVSWGTDDPEEAGMTSKCKMQVNYYCNINNRDDPNCYCWNDEHKNSKDCKTYRTKFTNKYNSDLINYSIDDHPDINRYILKAEVPCFDQSHVNTDTCPTLTELHR